MKDQHAISELKNGSFAPFKVVMSTLDVIDFLMKPVEDEYQDNLNKLTLYELKRIAGDSFRSFFTEASENNALNTGLVKRMVSQDGKIIYTMDLDIKNIILSSIDITCDPIKCEDPIVPILGEDSAEG